MSKNPKSLAAMPQKISFVILPRFNMATLVTLIEPLRIANYLTPTPLFQWQILSPDGPEVAASNGLTLAATPLDTANRRGDLVFVLASWGGEHYDNRDLLAWIRRQARDGARVCPVELGCYPVARAGLLTGRQVACHWSWAPGFQEQFPDVTVTEDLFTLGENPSCAGGLGGVDLMLHLIAASHGDTLAGEIADQMLYHPIRPAKAPQRRTLDEGISGLSPLMRQAITLIENTISDPLSVPDLAAALGLSQRQLERQFHQHIGCTAVQFGTLVRLQHARVLLISTKLGVREIATATGFNTLSHFDYAFRRCFDRRPSDYRQGWSKDEKTPSWPGTLAAYLDRLKARKA